MKMKIVALFSGGLDSTALVCHLVKQGHEVKCLGVDYGQLHWRELGSARKIATKLGLEQRTINLRSAKLLLSSALTNPEIKMPEGHYADESMKATIVPNRNMIMLSIAAGWAASLKFDAVAFAAHSGDFAIYPDCRPDFVAAMDNALAYATAGDVPSGIGLYAPFSVFNKADIVRIGHEAGAPFEDTWSCYKGGEVHCGKCGACVERREAFELAKIPDPTKYFA
jgi:7-cyano-7-deazaguanine synthase